MLAVPAGTRLTWVGEFSATGYHFWPNSIPDTISQVGDNLLSQYAITVESVHTDFPILPTRKGTITLELLESMDRGDGVTDDGLTDIRGNVDSAFSNLAGEAPAASRITDYTLPGNSAPVTTGAPPPPPPPSPSSGLFTSLPSAGTVTWVALGGLFILGAFFIFLKA